jgi:hypothetical protein
MKILLVDLVEARRCQLGGVVAEGAASIVVACSSGG